MGSKGFSGVFSYLYRDDVAEFIPGVWLQNCPCVPMVKEKNFPWTLLATLGVQSFLKPD